MLRQGPKIGQQVEAGEVLAIIHAATGVRDRHLECQVRCTCGTEFVARWVDLIPDGQGHIHTKSCGHRRGEYWRDQARKAESWTRRKIFDYAAAHGRQATAALFRVPKILVDFLCRLHWQILSLLPQQLRSEIYELANCENWHLEDIGRKFRRSIAEIRAILSIAHKAIKAKAAAREAAADELEEQVVKTETMMEQAIQAAGGREFWRPTGCLSGEELICHRDGTHGGVFGAVLDLGSSILSQVDRGLRSQFHRVIRDTIERRKALRRHFARERAAATARKAALAARALPAAA